MTIFKHQWPSGRSAGVGGPLYLIGKASRSVSFEAARRRGTRLRTTVRFEDARKAYPMRSEWRLCPSCTHPVGGAAAARTMV